MENKENNFNVKQYLKQEIGKVIKGEQIAVILSREQAAACLLALDTIDIQSTPAPPVIEPPKIEYMTSGRVIPEMLTPAQPPQKQERKTAEGVVREIIDELDDVGREYSCEHGLPTDNESQDKMQKIVSDKLSEYTASLQSRVRELEATDKELRTELFKKIQDIRTLSQALTKISNSDCSEYVLNIASSALSTLTEKP